jgi:hypothetical protein
MSAPRLELDFAGTRARGGAVGLGLAVLGAIALAAVAVQLHALSGQRAGLELRREALERVQQRGNSLAAVAGLAAQNVNKTVHELATPWSQLLAELENASTDSTGNIAVLSIEPDHAKHRVRVTAEARTLDLALAYVQRLQKAQVLRYPMLDSHEIKADDRDHPVRFQLSADWSDAS